VRGSAEEVEDVAGQQGAVMFYSQIGSIKCYSDNASDPISEALSVSDPHYDLNAFERIEGIVKNLNVGEKFITYTQETAEEKPMKIVFGRVFLTERQLANMGEFDTFL
jgi:hypothetical protein